MNIYSVDRIEDGLAVLLDDDDKSCAIPVDQLPFGTKEGSILRLTEVGYVLDKETENERRNKVLSLQEKLRNKR